MAQFWGDCGAAWISGRNRAGECLTAGERCLAGVLFVGLLLWFFAGAVLAINLLVGAR